MTDEKPVASITAMFAVEGWSFDPEQLTKIAGCKPTKIRYQELDALRGNSDFAQIGWWYDHTKIPRWSLDDAVREILQVFYERRREIAEFAAEHNCSIHLSLCSMGMKHKSYM
jgi:hypothetical protein